MCPVEGCDKKYNTKSNLEVHMRKHEGTKPFECPDCHKFYISKWNMAKHQKKGCVVRAHIKYIKNLTTDQGAFD